MPGRQRALLAWAAAGAVLVVGQFYVAIPYIPTVAGRFNLSPTEAAWITSAFGLAYAPGMIVWGRAADRLGRVRVLTWGLAVAGLCTGLAGAALAHPAAPFGAFLAARALQGFVASSFSPAAVALLSERLPAAARPLGAAVIGVAFLAAAPLVQYGAAAAGAPLSAAFAVSVPLFFAAAASVRAVAAGSADSGPPAAGRRGLRPVPAPDRVMLAAWGAAAAVLFSFASFHAALPIAAAVKESGLGLSAASIRLLGTPGLLTGFLAPTLTRRTGARAAAVAGLAVAASAFLLAARRTPAALGAASVVLSAGIAVAVPSLMNVVAGRADASWRALALGIYTCILFLGASAGPLAMQALAAVPRLLFLVPAAALAAAAAALAAAREPDPLSAAAPPPERTFGG